jgi:hypothetical protein
MYADSQKQPGAQAGAEKEGSKPADEGNVVDAEYTEVKDRKG